MLLRINSFNFAPRRIVDIHRINLMATYAKVIVNQYYLIVSKDSHDLTLS